MSERVPRLGSVRLVRHEPALIAPFTDRTPLALIRRAKARGLALLEARVDLFARHDASHVSATVARANDILPVLLTIRASKEGGAWRSGDAARLSLYRALLPLVSAVDVELDAPIRGEVVKTLSKVPGVDSTSALLEYVAATEKDKMRPSRVAAQKIVDQRSSQ